MCNNHSGSIFVFTRALSKRWVKPSTVSHVTHYDPILYGSDKNIEVGFEWLLKEYEFCLMLFQVLTGMIITKQGKQSLRDTLLVNSLIDISLLTDLLFFK